MATNHFETPGDNPRQTNLPLDFSSIQSLPDSHAWPESNGDQVSDGDGSFLPIIDLNDPNAVEQIGFACESWGAFLLKNHGVPLSVIEEVEVQTKRLFALPTEQKLKALRSPDFPTGYGTAWISPHFQKRMWQEGFTIFGSAANDAKKIWPDDYEQFCDAIEKFENEMELLVEKLIHKAFKFLGISQEEKNWVGSNNHTGAVHLNCYPVCPEPEQAMGLAPHTDTSIFTVLHQSQRSGLQVFKEGAGWVTVPLEPNALVVNTGDVLHILSNARFKSALHRVTANKIKQRYSMVYFYRATLDRVVSPLVPNSEQARYRGLTFKEYVGIKNKHLNEALSIIST